MSCKSQQFSLEKQEKEIEEAFDNVFHFNSLPKDTNEISFYHLGEVLYLLNIFKETFNDIGILINESNKNAKSLRSEIKHKKFL